MKDEYLMLREEIIHLDTIISNVVNLFYAFIASFIAFALLQSDTIFILLSYIVIIPAYMIVLNKMKAMYRIAAYLKIFHEGNEFNWETRYMQYKDKNESSRFRVVSWHYPFMVVSIAVTALLIYKMEWDKNLSFYEISKLFVGLLCMIFIAINMIKYKNLGVKDYINKWDGIN